MEAVAAPSRAATAPAIAVAGVSKWFDTADGQRLEALRDISLEVPAQSILAILGASGCGKSTLLNIISGILAPGRRSSWSGSRDSRTPFPTSSRAACASAWRSPAAWCWSPASC